MARPKNFPHQIEKAKEGRIETAGLIKAGWKAPSGAGGMARIPGFVIAHDTLGPDGLPVVDEAAMMALGMSADEVAALLKVTTGADQKNLKVAGVEAEWAALKLPQSLYFVIDRTPVKTPDGSWDYPDMLSMTFQRYTEPVLDKDGRQLMNPPAYQGGKEKPVEKKHFRPWCIGDGETAKRIQDDGSVREIRCALIGNGDPANVCPWSANGSCKAHTTLAVTLATVEKKTMMQRGEDGKKYPVEYEGLAPLTRVKGVRHRLETKSPHNGASFLAVLDTVADKLEGNIGGIDGTIRFSKASTVYSNAGKPSETKVGRVTIGLNPFAIEARLNALRAARGYHIAAPEPQALLSAPEDAGDMPDVGEDMAPPLHAGEPSRGEAINAGLEDGHPPMDDPPIGSTPGPPEPTPVKLTMKEIGTLLKAKFEASATSNADAAALIRRLGFDTVRIEAALDADIKARADAMADEAAAKPADNQTEGKKEETIL